MHPAWNLLQEPGQETAADCGLPEVGRRCTLREGFRGAAGHAGAAHDQRGHSLGMTRRGSSQNPAIEMPQRGTHRRADNEAVCTAPRGPPQISRRLDLWIAKEWPRTPSPALVRGALCRSCQGLRPGTQAASALPSLLMNAAPWAWAWGW